MFQWDLNSLAVIRLTNNVRLAMLKILVVNNQRTEPKIRLYFESTKFIFVDNFFWLYQILFVLLPIFLAKH